MSDTSPLVITGGAGPAEAAAIAAAVNHLLEVEAERQSHAPQRPRLSRWVMSANHPTVTTPLHPWTQPTRRTSER